ncbi:hypothetical protein [Pseudothauera rhizosphaerae]|nr:hypothetical protein [Pseudothauera rhizosphaerae]
MERWQAADNLGWNGEDVREVARYLNGRYYRYPAPVARDAER